MINADAEADQMVWAGKRRVERGTGMRRIRKSLEHCGNTAANNLLPKYYIRVYTRTVSMDVVTTRNTFRGSTPDFLIFLAALMTISSPRASATVDEPRSFALPASNVYTQHLPCK